MGLERVLIRRIVYNWKLDEGDNGGRVYLSFMLQGGLFIETSCIPPGRKAGSRVVLSLGLLEAPVPNEK